MTGHRPFVTQMAPGQPHERVLERRGLHLDLADGQPGRRQRQDHGADQVSRPAHDHMPAVTLDILHFGEPGQEPVIERHRRNEPHPRAAADPLRQPRGAVDRDDAAPVDQRHPVTQPLGLLHVAGDQDDRRPAVAYALDEVLNERLGGVWEAGAIGAISEREVGDVQA
jgi:hypothetical protein